MRVGYKIKDQILFSYIKDSHKKKQVESLRQVYVKAKLFSCFKTVWEIISFKFDFKQPSFLVFDADRL